MPAPCRDHEVMSCQMFDYIRDEVRRVCVIMLCVACALSGGRLLPHSIWSLCVCTWSTPGSVAQ